jgi:integrase
VETARLAEWEALAAGRRQDAYRHCEAAVKLAQASGFAYKPTAALLAGDIDQLIERISAVTGPQPGTKAMAEALLGTVPVALPNLEQIKKDYIQMTETDRSKKSPKQQKRWRYPRDRAVRNFTSVVGVVGESGKPEPPHLDQITRDDVLRFRDWWAKRVESGMDPESANKDSGHLAKIVREWLRLKKIELQNPFEDLRFKIRKNGNKTVYPPFSRAHVRDVLLAPGALDGLNDEARDIFLLSFNTGIRPSETCGARPEHFVIDHNIPHLVIVEVDREVKVLHTEREITLLGVSLEAARRIRQRGGISRYADNADGWSALVGKYLRNNNLLERFHFMLMHIQHL